MRTLLIVAAILSMACGGPKEAPQTTHQAYKIYEGPAPGSENWDWEEYHYTDQNGDMYFANIKDPEIIAYLPEEGKATGAAMIVCPGGGFTVSYFTKEGTNVAEWLAEHGVAAFVLKYRLVHFAHNSEEAFYSISGSPAPKYTPEEAKALEEHRPIGIQMGYDDGRAAIAYLRTHASEFGIDPDRIGIMGFSAGALLSIDVALNHTPQNRPNLVAPVYGEITPMPESLPEDAAPLFIAAPEYDIFNGLTAIDMMLAWRNAGRPAEAHYFAYEGHGFGYTPDPQRQRPSYVWIDLFYTFMQKSGFLGRQFMRGRPMR